MDMPEGFEMFFCDLSRWFLRCVKKMFYFVWKLLIELKIMDEVD